MENLDNSSISSAEVLKKYYKPDYSNMFNLIKQIKAPVKNKILIALLDGQWHSELELIRIGKKQQKYLGPVTLGTITRGVNSFLGRDNYLEKKVVNGKMHYKISDNYVGLSRAALRFHKYYF